MYALAALFIGLQAIAVPAINTCCLVYAVDPVSDSPLSLFFLWPIFVPALFLALVWMVLLKQIGTLEQTALWNWVSRGAETADPTPTISQGVGLMYMQRGMGTGLAVSLIWSYIKFLKRRKIDVGHRMLSPMTASDLAALFAGTARPEDLAAF